MTSESNWNHGIVIGQSLLGTCEILGNYLRLHDLDPELENSGDFCTALDNTVLCCEQCGWWDEPNRINDRGICVECDELEDDDDEKLKDDY